MVDPLIVRAGEGERVEYSDMEFVLRATAETTDGAFGIVEELNVAATPSHTHHAEDELFYVLEGEHVFTIAGREHTAGPGDVVFAPRGIPHAKRQVNDGSGRTLTMFSPAGFEQFFRDMADAEQQHGRVDRAMLMELGSRYHVDWHLD